MTLLESVYIYHKIRHIHRRTVVSWANDKIKSLDIVFLLSFELKFSSLRQGEDRDDEAPS